MTGWRRVLGLWAALALMPACGRPDAPDARHPTPRADDARAAGPAAASSGDPLMSEPPEYAERAVSAEAGELYFTRTGVGDPYGAGFPYPVFLALMQRYPELLGADWREFDDRFGTFPPPGAAADPGALPVGFYLTTDPLTRVPFLMMNCQICHADRLRLPGGDRVVTGMGSKTVRLHAYDRALMRIARDPALDEGALFDAAIAQARAHDVAWPEAVRLPVLRATLVELRARAAARAADVDRLGDGLPGRVATIPGFVMALNHREGTRLPLPEARGWVKIPDVAVWRYRETNSYDGVVAGAPVALVAEADFAFGVRPRWYDEHRHIATSMLMWLRELQRDLPYPGSIDRALADHGRAVFERECARCHGSYRTAEAPEATVAYRERIVAHDVVGTDSARLDAVTAEFVDAANTVAATRGLTVVRATGGYVPRPLVQVWARGLYGHAGQWPSIAVLATPPDARPRRFVVDPAAPYDVDHMGLAWRAAAGGDAPELPAYLYDADQPGFDVGGHEFLSRLADADRGAVVEYLKTL